MYYIKSNPISLLNWLYIFQVVNSFKTAGLPLNVRQLSEILKKEIFNQKFVGET